MTYIYNGKLKLKESFQNETFIKKPLYIGRYYTYIFNHDKFTIFHPHILKTLENDFF